MRKPSLYRAVVTALMAAMITVMTAYICHIPIGANGNYLHFGDALIYLSACMLPTPYALLAAAIGGGLADLLTAPMWALPTILIKAALTLPFRADTEKMLTVRNLLCLPIAAVITVGGYYIAESLLFGSFTASLAAIPMNLIQAAGSAVIFVVAAAALDKAKIKKVLRLQA